MTRRRAKCSYAGNWLVRVSGNGKNELVIVEKGANSLAGIAINKRVGRRGFALSRRSHAKEIAGESVH
jgi:hypothetical protein